MAFRETITLVVDVVTGQSKGAISGLKSELDGADGAFAKVKAAGTSMSEGTSSAFDKLKSAGSSAFDSLKANAGNFALAGASALAGFAVKAIGDFQKTALGAGQLRDSLGITSDEASRFQEVAGDLGIGVGTLESAMGRMNRTAQTTPGAFEEIGAAIAHNADGTTNVTQTFLNVIDALHRIEDPTKRAAAAQKILGKSWMESSELIAMGADGVRAAMAGVEDAKIIDDKEIQQAREFRDQMDALKGVAESLSIEVGSHLVPALTSAGETIGNLGGPLGQLKSAYEDVLSVPGVRTIYENIAPWEQLGTRWQQAGEIANFLTGASDDLGVSYNQAASEALAAYDSHLHLFDGIASVGNASNTTATEVAGASTQARILGEANRIAADGAAKLTEQTNAAVAALQIQAGAMRSSADSAIAAEDAQERFADAAANTAAVSRNGAATARELDNAVDGERDSMIAAANAAVELAGDQARASGTSLSAAGSIDAFNGSLLNNARFATPQARGAIAAYIVQANGVPASKATEITAAIRAGDIPRAQSLLTEASQTRNAAIIAQANTGQAERDLNSVARPRTAVVSAVMTGGDIMRRAGGGSIPGAGVPGDDGRVVRVGENGPEDVRLPVGSHVFKENETRARGAATSPIVVNVNNNGRDLTGYAVAMAIRQAQLAQ